jgi:hypothetical protein
MDKQKWYLKLINIFIILLLVFISFETYLVLKKINIHNYFCKNININKQDLINNQPVTVELYKISKEDNNITYDTYGTIVGEYECPIIFEQGGNINYISENRYVKKGDLLISLDSISEEAKLLSLQKNLDFKNAKLARVQKLVKNNILSINEEENLESEIAELESKIVEIEQRIKSMKLYAVTDGYFFLNNTANKINGHVPGRQQIGYFFSHKKFIKFFLPHEFIKYLANEGSSNDTLDVLFFPDFNNNIEPLKGKLKLSSNNDNLRPLTVQENEHKNAVCESLAELDSEEKLSIQYFYNRTGKIHLTFNYKESYILIPEIAVYNRGVKNYVYVVQDNMAILTEVEIIGTTKNGMFKIKSGNISDNTVIILKGLNKVHHMSKIKAVI